jgi:hypothetical protein
VSALGRPARPAQGCYSEAVRFDPACRAELERALAALLVRYGASEAGLADAVRLAIDASEDALAASASDGRSLSPLDVLRIRAGKFAATRVPAAVFRDAARIAALRREIHTLCTAALPDEAARGSRF